MSFWHVDGDTYYVTLYFLPSQPTFWHHDDDGDDDDGDDDDDEDEDEDDEDMFLGRGGVGWGMIIPWL